MTLVPVILAGGIGERFWPLSRSSRPKQLLALTSSRTMLEETLARAQPLGKKETLIITSSRIAPLIRTKLGAAARCRIVAEPQGRNTAPAVALGAAMVAAHHGSEAVMVVLSADHAISPQAAFVRAVRFAARIAAREERLVVFGISPTRPDTGYGYIHAGGPLPVSGPLKAAQVRRFVEKPIAARARRYCASGEYLWNSGMFVWKAGVVLEEFARYMPALYTLTMRAADSGFSSRAIAAFYRDAESQSVDYGIMERTTRAAVVTAPFTWDDVGSWEAIARHHPTNPAGTAVVGTPLYESTCTNSIVVNRSGRAMAAVGLRDVVLVATDDAVLAISRSELPALKKHLAKMKEAGFGAALF